MATLYTHQSQNIWKTYILMLGFFIFLTGLGYFASWYTGSNFPFIFSIVASVFMNLGSYWFSDKLALSISHARQIELKDYPEYWRTAENIAITSGLPMPRLYVIDDPSPNAFATGRNKKHAAIAVSTGLLNMMDKSELEGVLAHEFSHIGNRDILLMGVVVVLVGLVQTLVDWTLRISFRGKSDDNKGSVFLVIGFFLLILSPIIATIIQLAVSRKREFLADATGALITRYPEGLASALQKISDYHSPMATANSGTAHLFIATPFGGDTDKDGVLDKHQKVSWLKKMFMTHPPIPERINALLNK